MGATTISTATDAADAADAAAAGTGKEEQRRQAETGMQVRRPIIMGMALSSKKIEKRGICKRNSNSNGNINSNDNDSIISNRCSSPAKRNTTSTKSETGMRGVRDPIQDSQNEK